MTLIDNYYKKIIQYDLINKFFYYDLNKIPKLEKIILNFGVQEGLVLKNVAASFLALELITNKQSIITKPKQTNMLLKVKKGTPVGCLLILKKNSKYLFLFKLLTQVFPNLKDFNGVNFSKKSNSKNFSFTLTTLIAFQELETQFYLFRNLPPLNVTLITNTKTRKEFLFLLNSFKIPLQNKKFDCNYNSIGRV